MNLLLAAFEKLISPEQREMQTLISKYGGSDEVKKNDNALANLIKESSHLVERGEDTLQPSQPSSITSPGGAGAGNALGAPLGRGQASSNKSADPALTVESLRAEFSENLDHVLEKNLEIFNRKFEIQKRQISEDLERIVARASDRIIAAVTEGPHDRILDTDMHNIWKNMVSALSTFLCCSLLLMTGWATRVGRVA